MSSDAPSRWTAAAVFVGAVGLVGLPATAVLLATVVSPLTANLGTSTVVLLVEVVLVVLAIAAGLQIATEAAFLQLHGVVALRRGSRAATVVRYGFLVTVTVLALAGVLRLGLATLTAGLAAENPAVVLGGVALIAAATWVLVRGARALYRGYQADPARTR